MKNLLKLSIILALLFSGAVRAQSANGSDYVSTPGYTGVNWAVKDIAATTSGLLVYPNPVVSHTHIVLPAMTTGTVTVDVIDLNGHVDRTFQSAPGAWELDVDMSMLPHDLYSVRVYDPTSGYYNLKVVKE